MEDSSGVEEAAPLESQPYMVRMDDLNIDEAVEILLSPDMTRISNAPAVLPRAGEVFVYVFSSYVKTEISRIRSDGYTWYSCSGKVLRSKVRSLRVQKYYWTIRSCSEAGDHRFKRQEFRFAQDQGIGRRAPTGPFVVIVHYLGDEKVTTAPSAADTSNGVTTKGSRSGARALGSQGDLDTSGSSVVTLGANDAAESHAAGNSKTDIDRQPGPLRLRMERRPEMVSVTPLSVSRPLPRLPHQLKRAWRQSPMHQPQLPKSNKLSKNNLLGQQVQATLDALHGDELIAARDEVYDFLRKWDKD